MDFNDLKERLSKLPDQELRKSLLLSEDDFQSGVYQLYLDEAKNREIQISEEEITKSIIEKKRNSFFFQEIC